MQMERMKADDRTCPILSICMTSFKTAIAWLLGLCMIKSARNEKNPSYDIENQKILTNFAYS